MTRPTIILLAAFKASVSLSQPLLYNDGGIVSVGSTAILTVENGLTNATASQFTGGGDIYVKGDWNNSTNALFAANNSTVHLYGANQNITSGGDAFNHVNATDINNNCTANKTITDNTTVNGTLTLNQVKILTQANILYIGQSGDVIRTNGGNTCEYIIGKLNKIFTVSPQTSETFEVGINTIYSPATITFATITPTGPSPSITLEALEAPHPNMATSEIDPNKTANMYWTTSQSDFTYTGANLTLFHNNSITGGNPFFYITKHYFNNNWTAPTPGTPTTISTPSSGQTSWGDFVVGETCTAIPCENCIPSFAPFPGKKYVLSAWVKENNNANLLTYENAAIELFFLGSTTTYTCTPSGNIIDGWQRIEQAFDVPPTAVDIKISLKNTSTNSSKDVYFDDIRIHPFDANMKSFVYDPITLRLTAELDNNNYATFYEYDEEGKLVRVKKETERGIVTIKENKDNTIKR